MTENEASRQVSAISFSGMAYTLALLLVAALAPQQCCGAAASNHGLHGHRGQRLRHGHHVRALPIEQIPSEDEAKDDVSEAPLYDDFLDIMNNAASKALSQQRAVPAYDDFLHFMKKSAEAAHEQQVGKPSYDEFLGFLKGKTDEAYRQQMEIPSYDDFLTALKVSSTEALQEPVPSYEQFLNTLKDAATAAMQKRVHADARTHSVEAFKNENSDNPLEHVKRGFRKAKNQMQGKKDEHHERNKLQEELRELKEEKKRHASENDGRVPHHVKKPIMKRINVLRTQLCWKRPNLWQHEKCLRFLGIHCMQESTGEGICKAFTKKATQKCKTAKDSHWRDDYCALSEALEETHGDEEEEDASEDEEEEEDDDHHGAGEDDDDEHDENDDHDHGVGSDDDIGHDLEDMDKELAEHQEEHDEHGNARGGPPEIQGRVAADRDGDGVTDDKDAFPDDPKEWLDTDKDGIGNNADTDDDGDGHDDDVDPFPLDPKEWKDTNNNGIGDNADTDRDGDGVVNDKDKFPDDPTEWLDSDGDGHGDNKDAYPYNPNCHSNVLPCLDLDGAKKFKPGSPQDPTTLDKAANRALPTQGYSEHMEGAPVKHENYYTWVGDWQREFPDMPDSEKNTMSRICSENPNNSWCKRFANRDAHFR